MKMLVFFSTINLKNTKQSVMQVDRLLLTKPLDMDHTWPRCGNGMLKSTALLWAIHGIAMGHGFPYETQMYVKSKFHCLFQWNCYVFGRIPYMCVPHILWYGVHTAQPHTNTI